MDMFQAVVQGYSDRLFDYQVLAAHAGFWSGYYSGVKRPKPLQQIVESMYRKRHNKQEHADDVDVEAFLAMEHRFQTELQR